MTNRQINICIDYFLNNIPLATIASNHFASFAEIGEALEAGIKAGW